MCAGECPIGFYCPAGSTSPTPCPSGTFGSASALPSSQCSGQCPAGFFCPQQTSIPCQCSPNTHSSPGARAATDCWLVRVFDASGGAAPSVSAAADAFNIPVWPSALVEVPPTLPPLQAWVSVVANCDPGDTLSGAPYSPWRGQPAACGSEITILANYTADAWRAAFAGVRLSTSPRNAITAPRRVRFALASRSIFVDISVAVPTANDPPQLLGVLGSGGIGLFPSSAAPRTLNLTEGAPAEVLLAVTGNCSALASFTPFSATPMLCYQDPDPLLGRALANSTDLRTDTYLGAAISDTLSNATDDGGAAMTQLSRYTLSATVSGAAFSCASLVPVGTALWDCTTLFPPSDAWLQAATTAPPTLQSKAALKPHTPFGLAPSLHTGLTDTPCLAQRYRIVFGSSAPLPEDGCGTWNSTSPPCGLDFEASYCGSTTPIFMAPTFSLALSLTDNLLLNNSTLQVSPATLQVTVLDAREAPALAWADNATLTALGCPSGLCYPSSTLPVQLAAVDDTTAASVHRPISASLSNSSSVFYPPLLVCSQDIGSSATLGARVRALPVEGASPLPPPYNATALFTLRSLAPAKRLNASAAPSCAAVLSAQGSAAFADSSSALQAGAPMLFVQAFELVGGSAAALRGTPGRAFTLIAEPLSAGVVAPLSAPLRVPVHLVRANRPVVWGENSGKTFTLAEYSPIGTVTAALAVAVDPDAEQDVSFSLVSVALTSCDGNARITDFSLPEGTFMVQPVPNFTLVTDAAARKSSLVASRRQLAIGVGVDALALDEAAAACGVSLVTACTFELSLVARDSGDPTPSHSLLPLQPPTFATTALFLSVTRSLSSSEWTLDLISSVPSAGLSTAGGGALVLQGSLRQPSEAQSAVTLILAGGSADSNFTSVCTVVQRLRTLHCPSPPGWGTTLDLLLLVNSSRVALRLPSAVSYAAPIVVNSSIAPAPSTVEGQPLLLSVLNAPPLPSLTGVLQRSRGVWNVPLTTSFSCKQAPNSSSGGDTLTCALPSGVGAASAMDIAPATTSPPRISFPPPTITTVLQDCSSPAACSRFVIQGLNLGRAGSSACSTDPASCARAALDLQGFDAVHYQQQGAASLSASACIAAMGSSYLNASCAQHAAVNCTYLLPHTAIACQLDSSGWGQGFHVRIVVQGQASAWSLDTISYPPPTLLRAAAVWTGGVAPGPAQELLPMANGGSLVRIQGWGFSPVAQLVVSIGGVRVLPFGGADIGAFASGSSNASAPLHSDGSPAQAGDVRWAPLQSLLVCAPPGVGTVDLQVWMGNRSATLPLTFAAPRLVSWADPDGSTAGSTGLTLTAKVYNVPACALCLSQLNSTTGSVCSAFATQAPTPSAGQAPYTCPHLGAPGAFTQSLCALPSSMWRWGQCPRAAWGGIRTAAGNFSRCLPAPPPLFTLALTMADKWPRYSAISTSLFQSSRDLTVDFSLSGDSLLNLGLPYDSGVVFMNVSEITAVGPSSRIVSQQLAFSKVNLLGRLPALTPGSLDPSVWPPRGGKLITVDCTNANTYGFVLVFPAGVPAQPGSTFRLPTASRLPLCDLDPVPTYPPAGLPGAPSWLPGPFVCPLTLNSSSALGLNCTTGAAAFCPQLLYLQSSTVSQAGDVCLPTLLAPAGLPGYAGFRLGARGDPASAGRCLDALEQRLPGLRARTALETCNDLSPMGLSGGGAVWVEKAALPCSVSAWSDKKVSFHSPPWQGTVFISLAVDGQLSTNELTASYSAANVTSVTPNTMLPTAGNTTLTISGENFGAYQDLGTLWNASGAASLGLRLGAPPAQDQGAVVLLYPGPTSPIDRPCAVQSWTDTRIVCLTPEGIPGSNSYVAIVQTVSEAGALGRLASATSSSPNAISVTFAAATLETFTPASLGTEGGPITLLGSNLGRFECSALDCGALVSGSAPYWGARLVFSTSAADGYLRVASLSPLHLNHSAASFLMPEFEGAVTVRLSYASVGGTVQSSTPLTLTATAPQFSALRAIAAPSEPGTSFNPCAELAAPPSNSSSACIRAAFATAPWAPSQAPLASCFRGNASTTGSRTHLRIEGPPGRASFGVGGWPLQRGGERGSFITLVPLGTPCASVAGGTAAAAQPSWSVRCLPSSSQHIWKDATTLECALESDVPFGPVEICVGVAYRVVSLTGAGLNAQAACACGSFHDGIAGPFCQACPPGGSCRGGLDKARAIAGAWETVPLQWAQRSIPSVNLSLGFPRFTVCPYEPRCQGDSQCAAGAVQGAFMCSACPPGSVPGPLQQCAPCLPSDMAATGGALGSGAVAIAGLYLLLREGGLLRRYLRQCCAQGGGGVAAKPVSAAAAAASPLGSYIKIMLSFAQTLGALAVYTRGMLPASQQGAATLPLAQLMPWLLDKFSFFTNLGLNTVALSCLLHSIDFFTQQRLVMVLPVLPLLLFVLFLAARVVVAGLRRGANGPPLQEWAAAQWAATLQAAEGSAGWWVVFLSFLALPMSIQALATLQDCAPERAGGYLRSVPAISCRDPDFVAFQYLALGLGWTYLLLPTALALAMFRGYGFTRRLTFLLEGYRVEIPEARAWECTVMLRKSVLAGLSTSFMGVSDPRSQLVSSMFLLAAFLGMQGRFRPLKSAHLNTLDGYALTSELAFCFSIMIRQQGRASEKTFALAEDGSLQYAIGTSTASLGGLQEAPLLERNLFDVLAALLAFRFLLMWIFFLVDDKLFAGRGGARLAEWAAATAASAAALGRCGRKQGGAVNTLTPRFFPEDRVSGWRHVKDPTGLSLFYAPAWGGKDKEGAAVSPSEPLLQLPFLAILCSGWGVYTDFHALKSEHGRWEHTDSEGDIQDPPWMPPLDLPSGEALEELEERRAWRVFYRAGETVATWLNVYTGEQADELPLGAVTVSGWERLQSPCSGEPRAFYLDIYDCLAQWEVSAEDMQAALIEEEELVAAAEAVAAERERAPRSRAPPGWYAVLDEACCRALLWVHVRNVAALQAAARGSSSSSSSICIDAPEAALEPPLAPNSPFSLTLHGGWAWRECPAQQQGYVLQGQGGCSARTLPAPPLDVRLDASCGLALHPLPPPFNVWFPFCARDAPGQAFWVNAATGQSANGSLPQGGVAAWEAEGEEAQELHASTALATLRALPAAAQRAPWAFVPGSGQWQRQGVGGAFTCSVPCSADIPLGHVTAGGWRHIESPLAQGATLWIHPAMRLSRLHAPAGEDEPPNTEWVYFTLQGPGQPPTGIPTGLSFWINATTGQCALGDLPDTGRTGHGYSVRRSLGAVAYVQEETGELQSALPPWAPPTPLYPAWQLQEESGLWSQQQAHCVPISGSAIPVGHATAGGWWHVRHPLLRTSQSSCWLHPHLGAELAQPPSAAEEAAGRLAMRPAGPTAASSVHAPLAGGVWRRVEGGEGAAPLGAPAHWRQEGSGATALVLPEGAVLPGGWRGMAEEDGGGFYNLLTDVHAHVPPAEVLVARSGAWRFSIARALWWQEGSGAWAEALPIGAELLGGWCCMQVRGRVCVHGDLGVVQESVPLDVCREPAVLAYEGPRLGVAALLQSVGVGGAGRQEAAELAGGV